MTRGSRPGLNALPPLRGWFFYGTHTAMEAAVAGKRAFKGPRKGEFTCNPLGKNPGDVWVIPNVKHNHIEKTVHPCQFPIELVERLVLAFTDEGDLIVDPYLGVGSAACAAVLHARRAAGSEILREYADIAKERITAAFQHRLQRRPIDRPVYKPDPSSKIAKRPREFDYPLLPLSPQVTGD